ncbi:MAG: FAD-binding protein [Paracoccaceae bacterium]
MIVTSEAHLAETLRGATTPFAVVGGGTRGVAPSGGGEALDISAMSQVALYEPETLTLVAGAATPLSQITDLLAAHGQRLAFEPPDWRGLLATGGKPTIGGVIAANLSGPRRIQAGAARDALLGVRFVDGTGAIIRNGGRVMKNVTGYDLVRLMAGSWGTLGVLTEVALKTQPAPPAAATLVWQDRSVAEAAELMRLALATPYEVNGAARLPDGTVLARVEGFAASVSYRAGRLADTLGADRVEEGGALWHAVSNVAPFHGQVGDVWRFSVPPSDAPAIVARLPSDVLLDWGGGLIWALLPEGSDGRALAAPYRGHALLVRASAETRRRLPRFEPEDPAVACLTAGLRARFDPRALLNPGLMG